MKTPTEMLEEELAFFAAELEPDLDRLRDLAPRFVSLFTEAVLNTLVLQHALRKKGLLTGDDLIDATRDGLGRPAPVARRWRRVTRLSWNAAHAPIPA